MLRKPSAPFPPAKKAALGSGAMQVESTHVHMLADGKKMIDVTLRRAAASGSDGSSASGSQHAALVVPQFDEDSDDSSDSDDDRRAPVCYKPPRRKKSHEDEDNNNHEEGDAVSEEELPRKTPPKDDDAGHRTFQGDFKWEDVNDIQSLTNANTQLATQVNEFKRQIKMLQIQVEALAPVPGFNSDAIQDILLERDGGADHDIRDAKIVHQAKTLRQLKRTLQREKQLAVDAVKQCKRMETAKLQLEKEVDTLKLKAARFQARAAAAVNAQFQVGNGPQQEDSDAMGGTPALAPPSTVSNNGAVGGNDASLKKKYEDLKGKSDKLQQDLKKLQRALQREVGDDVSLEEIIENADNNSSGKRGRAQQIVMLKAKVKKLEAELAKAAAASSSEETSAASSGVSSHNVDLRAQQELTGQHLQKQKQIDKLTHERDDLQQQLHHVTRKCDGVKSRAQILEKEKQESKGKFQLLVDKSKNDDALIDALQRQLETWKSKMQEAKRVRTAESASSSNSSSSAQREERMELERLRNLVAEYKRHGAMAEGAAAPDHPRQRPPSSSSSSSFSVATGMPLPSEASQYRTMAAEKERLTEVVKGLQAQLEEKERQLRQANRQQQPPTPSMLPALSKNDASVLSRIPRKAGMPALTQSNHALLQPTPPPQCHHNSDDSEESKHSAEVEAIRRTFRESLKTKEDQIAALTMRLQDLETLRQHPRENTDELAQEVQDLQEENEFLRQEFDKLKSRYESLAKNTKSNSSSSKVK